jgi:hypothetical protein
LMDSKIVKRIYILEHISTTRGVSTRRLNGTAAQAKAKLDRAHRHDELGAMWWVVCIIGRDR